MSKLIKRRAALAIGAASLLGLATPALAATITGTGGPDVIRGTSDSDVLNGRGGNDVLTGLGDSERLLGGPGDDRLTGGGDRDRLLGGAGNDRINAARDDHRDVVSCGSGVDTVVADRSDSVAGDCERVTRVGGDGVWYQVGYNGEVTTALPRGSDALREVMKKHPEFDWNKMLTRSAKQVFQLDGAWYALEAKPDQE